MRLNAMKSLKGKNIIITGAANGIGRLMAMRAAEEGANLAIIDINRAALNEVGSELKGSQGMLKTYVCDISHKDMVGTVSDKIKNDFKSIDILINNAGVVKGKSFLDLSIEEMEKTMDINFWGHVYFTKHFLPGMIEKKSGNIVNVASSAGLLGMVDLSDYSASKFADVGFTETLRRELKRDGHKGVSITCVCPYIIDTGMFKGFKPLLFSPVVKPQTAANKIIKAIKKEKTYVLLPYYNIKGMQFLKLFPTSFFDWALRVFGGSKAMSSFEGRE